MKTGTQVLREALLNRMRKLNLGRMAQDIGVSLVALEAFATGKANLTPDILVKLAPQLFPNAIWDPEIDRLRPENQQPPSSYVLPPTYVPEPRPPYPFVQGPGPQLANSPTPQPSALTTRARADRQDQRGAEGVSLAKAPRRPRSSAPGGSSRQACADWKSAFRGRPDAAGRVSKRRL
jgi:hypothetical protein